jgi:hypothetical protein
MLTTISKRCVLVILFATGSCTAYPIKPQSLPTLCERSDLVVVARVIDVRHREEHGDWPDRATLKLTSVLKGNWARPTLHVLFNSGVLCPVPADYKKGESVVAFLRRHEDQTSFTTVGLSYGVKVPTDEYRPTYVNQIVELLRIQQHPGSPQREAMLAEWLVKSIEDGDIRWEAALYLYGDDWPHESNSKDRLHRFARSLKQSQVDRLMHIFSAEFTANPKQSPVCADVMMEILAIATDSQPGLSHVTRIRDLDGTTEEAESRIIQSFLATLSYESPKRARASAGTPSIWIWPRSCRKMKLAA